MIGDGPTTHLYSPSGGLSCHTHSGLNGFTQQLIIYSSSTLFSSLGSTDGHTISLVRRRKDDQSPGSHSDFVSHSTGRLCVRNKLTLWEGALSLGATVLSSFGAGRYHRLLFVIIFRLHSYTSVYSFWRTEAHLRFLSLHLALKELGLLIRHTSPCLITQQTEISVMFKTTYLITQQTGILQKASLQFYFEVLKHQWTSHESHTLVSCVWVQDHCFSLLRGSQQTYN